MEIKTILRTLQSIRREHSKISDKVSLIQKEIIGCFENISNDTEIYIQNYNGHITVYGAHIDEDIPRYNKDIDSVLKAIFKKGHFSIMDMDDASDLPF